MGYMFFVRSSPCPAPDLHSSPPPHTLRALRSSIASRPRSLAISRLPAHSSPRTVCPPFDSRQYTLAFDQPLSVDTSSVTNMNFMFWVHARRSRAMAPSIQFGLPHARAACAAAAPCRLPARTSPRVAYALLSTRQLASAFNQPLSFDTSSVTDMRGMFRVRSPRVPWLPRF